MTIAREKMAEAAKDAAAGIARRLGMHRHNDITTLKPDQTIMIASANGIQMGTLKTRNMVNMRYIAYKLNNEKVFEERYLFNGKAGWDTKPTTKSFLDKDAVVYVAE
jgi:hypothetical protein